MADGDKDAIAAHLCFLAGFKVFDAGSGYAACVSENLCELGVPLEVDRLVAQRPVSEDWCRP